MAVRLVGADRRVDRGEPSGAAAADRAAGAARGTDVTEPLPRPVRVGYSLGSVATGAFGTVPGLLLLPYLTDTLGVAAGLAGVLVLLPKAWDVLINPVVGRVSDRTTTRIGARRPYLLGGGLALGVLFALMFAGPFGTSAAAPVWVTVLFLLTATAYAIFQVPYVAMPAEMTHDGAERTRLMTWRVAILAVAILISGAIAPAIAQKSIAGHRWMGVFVGALIIAGALGAFLGTRRAPIGEVQASEPTLRAQFAVARRNRPFRALLTCFVIQAAGIATMLAGVKYFADHVLDASKGGPTYLFACFVGPALLVMPLWSRAGARLGKLRAFTLASLLFAAGGALLGLVALVHAPAVLAYLATAIVGCGYAGEQVFALSMLPDCIALDARRTGRRQAGVFTGLWTAGETLGLALGPGIFAVLLQISGYVSSKGDTIVAQPAGARTGIAIGFTVLPAVIVAVALLFLRPYRSEPELA
ncbi:MAG TPA: MFS transporter [Micromonosporaceae bacterium]